METIDANKEIMNKLNQIQVDIQIIKEHIGPEGELTDWVKEELEESKKIPLSETVSQEEVEKMILENDL